LLQEAIEPVYKGGNEPVYKCYKHYM